MATGTVDGGIATDREAAFDLLHCRLTALVGPDRATALAWVRSDREGHGSFRWVCEVLDLKVERARRMLETLRKADLNNILARFRSSFH